MKARLAQVLVVAVIFGTVEVDIGGEKYVLLSGESRAFAADDREEGEGEQSKRRGRAAHAKFKAYDPSQKTVFVIYHREGTGDLEATWDVERHAEIIVDGKKGKLQVRHTGEKEPPPLTVALDRWSGRRVRLEIALAPKDPKAARLAIDWRGIVITGGDRRPAPSDGQSRQDG